MTVRRAFPASSLIVRTWLARRPVERWPEDAHVIQRGVFDGLVLASADIKPSHMHGTLYGARHEPHPSRVRGLRLMRCVVVFDDDATGFAGMFGKRAAQEEWATLAGPSDNEGRRADMLKGHSAIVLDAKPEDLMVITVERSPNALSSGSAYGGTQLASRPLLEHELIPHGGAGYPPAPPAALPS